MAKETGRSGPYKTKFGHLFWTVRYDDGTRRSVLVHREVMEKHLGRKLMRHEIVHHKNENPADNRIKNLELHTAASHTRHHQLGRPSPLKGIEHGWRHGTIYSWMKKKCTCATCEAAKDAWNAARAASRFGVGPTDGYVKGPYQKNPEHGTSAKYCRGCRCELCRAANSDRERQRRLRKMSQ